MYLKTPHRALYSRRLPAWVTPPICTSHRFHSFFFTVVTACKNKHIPRKYQTFSNKIAFIVIILIFLSHLLCKIILKSAIPLNHQKIFLKRMSGQVVVWETNVFNWSCACFFAMSFLFDKLEFTVLKRSWMNLLVLFQTHKSTGASFGRNSTIWKFRIHIFLLQNLLCYSLWNKTNWIGTCREESLSRNLPPMPV